MSVRRRLCLGAAIAAMMLGLAAPATTAADASVSQARWGCIDGLPLVGGLCLTSLDLS
jgi:hypothetical protein